ncbi:hypothetical protein B0H63DRAFT_536213 [Podospora didyma]|uniref:Uncharacterized protein n=1 Tax=Podospora didyma TaxID=330526 RepID=A0AAE0K0X0_9PEZI|nr:hypothetical protein B0H63DRAFT_536213 [Podospora didyma]
MSLNRPLPTFLMDPPTAPSASRDNAFSCNVTGQASVNSGDEGEQGFGQHEMDAADKGAVQRLAPAGSAAASPAQTASNIAPERKMTASPSGRSSPFGTTQPETEMDLNRPAADSFALLVASIDIALTQPQYYCHSANTLRPTEPDHRSYSQHCPKACHIDSGFQTVHLLFPGTLRHDLGVKGHPWGFLGSSKSPVSAGTDSECHSFHHSHPRTGPNGLQTTSLIFNSPRTILLRLIAAAASTGELLSLPAPAVNSSYQVQFWAPYVRCEESNTTIAAMINQALTQSVAANKSGASLVYTGYFAYVPDLSSSGRLGQPGERAANASRSSNELWLTYKSNGTGWNTFIFPHYPVNEYSFLNGRMRVTYDDFAEQDLGPPVAYPPAIVDSTNRGELAGLDYAAWFWPFSDLLVGSMSLCAEDPTDKAERWFSVLDIKLSLTALVGSASLNCFFAWGVMFYNATNPRPSEEQRLQDIAFAGDGMPLDKLIPELSMNVTISLMSNALLAPAVPVQVNVTTPIDVYAYHAQTLLVSYGTTLFAATPAVTMGLVAFARNEVRMDKSFSFVVSATQGLHLFDEILYERRGDIPVLEKVRRKRVKYQRLLGPKGGWGGCGPSVDRLFYQSNLGIVTKIGIHLTPAPACYAECEVSVPNQDQLAIMVRTIAHLERVNIIQNHTSISNPYCRALPNSPPTQTSHRASSRPECRAKNGWGYWTGNFAIYSASAAILDANWALVQERLLETIPGAKFKASRHYSNPGERLNGSKLPPIDIRHTGIPRIHHNMLVSLRGANGAHTYFSPLFPTDGVDMQAWWTRALQLTEEAAFDMIADFHVYGWYVIAIALVVFGPGDGSRVKKLFGSLLEDAEKVGVTEYRTYIRYIDQLRKQFDFEDNALGRMLSGIKGLLDPTGILSQGKSGIWTEVAKN